MTATTEAALQVHDHLRTLFQVAVSWFTFFLTLLIGVMGWSLKACMDKKGRLIRIYPFLFALLLFEIQMLLGIVACEHVAAEIEGARTSAVGFIPTSYSFGLTMMVITLKTNMVFWPGVGLWVWKMVDAAKPKLIVEDNGSAGSAPSSKE